MSQTVQVARSTPSDEETRGTERFRGHVAECRSGDFSGLDCLVEAVAKGTISPFDVGVTDAEIQEFRESRTMQDGELAAQYLAEAREGDFGNFVRFAEILGRQPTIKIRLELRDEEYFVLVKRHNVEACSKIVVECREGKFDKLPELILFIEKRRVFVDEIGTSEEEILLFAAKQYVEAGKQAVEQCRDGNYTNLIPLLHDLRYGRFSDADVGTTPEEVSGFWKAGIGESLEKLAAECRDGRYRNLPALKSILESLPESMLPDLDFDAEEIARWERLATLTGVQVSRSRTGLKVA